MAKYLVQLSDGTNHIVRSLKGATTLAGGEPFVAQKVGRGGKRSKVLRKYEVLGTMAHCVASKEIS